MLFPLSLQGRILPKLRSESETRSARSRQYADSDPDEHEQACDEYGVQHRILPLDYIGDDFLHVVNYYRSTSFSGIKKARVLYPCLYRYFTLYYAAGVGAGSSAGILTMRQPSPVRTRYTRTRLRP